MSEKTKLQTLLDRRDYFEERSSNLESMLLKIRISERPETVKIGWFSDKPPKVLSWPDTWLFCEFLRDEKSKADNEVLEINIRLKKLEKIL